MLTVGDTFPSFSVEAVNGKETLIYTEKDLKGTWTILFFFPEAFTFICPSEINAFNERYGELLEKGAYLIGGSVDELEIQREWAKELGVSYPLFADYKLDLAKKVGVLENDNRTLRATFIIDPEGVIQFAMASGRNVGRSVTETLRIFDAIKTGKACPVEWIP